MSDAPLIRDIEALAKALDNTARVEVVARWTWSQRNPSGGWWIVSCGAVSRPGDTITDALRAVREEILRRIKARLGELAAATDASLKSQEPV